jgi:hypothetical protein
MMAHIMASPLPLLKHNTIKCILVHVRFTPISVDPDGKTKKNHIQSGRLVFGCCCIPSHQQKSGFQIF